MAVAAPDQAGVLLLLHPLLALVDVVEVRLDAMQQPDVAQLRAAIARPLLYTNRPEWEGGAYRGSEEQRLALLHQAALCGADYVDLELRAAPQQRHGLLASLVGRTGRMIISWHDFSCTPPTETLADILARQADSGAHIGKIVTMAREPADVRRVLALLELAEQRRFPLIAFCMGAAGRVSRVATLALGGFMTYAAPDGATGTAPGQLSVSQLRGMLRTLEGEA